MIITKAYYGDIRQNPFNQAMICLGVHGRPSTEYERELERTRENLCKWELSTDVKCEYGNVQSSNRLLECPMLPVIWERKDFRGKYLKGDTITTADFWTKKEIWNYNTTDRHVNKKKTISYNFRPTIDWKYA